MKNDVRKKSKLASRRRGLVALVVMCVLCVVMVPAVAATGVFIDNTSVTVNESYFATIDGTNYNWNNFFGILTAAGYTYTYGHSDSGYSDRKPLLTLTIDDETFPASEEEFGPDYEWKIVDTLDENAYLFKKGLAGWVDSADSGETFYLWFGNDTAARGYYNGRDDWLFPTVENATYIVGLEVNFE